MILLNILVINLALILVIDLSGFIPSVKRLISKWLTKNQIETDSFRIRPFDCSYCMTFWCTLLFIIVTGQFTFLNLLLVIIITHLTDVTRQTMLLIKDLLLKIINTAYDKLID